MHSALVLLHCVLLHCGCGEIHVRVHCSGAERVFETFSFFLCLIIRPNAKLTRSHLFRFPPPLLLLATASSCDSRLPDLAEHPNRRAPRVLIGPPRHTSQRSGRPSWAAFTGLVAWPMSFSCCRCRQRRERASRAACHVDECPPRPLIPIGRQAGRHASQRTSTPSTPSPNTAIPCFPYSFILLVMLMKQRGSTCRSTRPLCSAAR